MEEHVKILQLLCNNPSLGILNKQSEVDLSAVVELQGAGYITVSDTFKPLDGSAPTFAAPRITMKGRVYLEDQLSNRKRWYHPILKTAKTIWFAVIAFLIAIAGIVAFLADLKSLIGWS